MYVLQRVVESSSAVYYAAYYQSYMMTVVIEKQLWRKDMYDFIRDMIQNVCALKFILRSQTIDTWKFVWRHFSDQ